MLIVDLANEVYEELNEDSMISIPSVAFWLRNGTNIGKLNDLINTTFGLNASLEIIDSSSNQIGFSEAAIYAQLFYVSFYTRKAQSFLGAAGIDNVTNIQSDGGVITFVNRNEIAKTFIQLKKDAKTTLDQLINRYKFYNTRAVQVTGDDLFIPEHPLEYGRRNLLT